MNRRGFLRALGIMSAAAVAAAKLPAALFATDPIRLFEGPLMFRGIPVIYDRDCPSNTIYFLNPQTLWVNRGRGWERPFEVRH